MFRQKSNSLNVNYSTNVSVPLVVLNFNNATYTCLNLFGVKRPHLCVLSNAVKAVAEIRRTPNRDLHWSFL